jgi:hypothetical protein
MIAMVVNDGLFSLQSNFAEHFKALPSTAHRATDSHHLEKRTQ